MSNPPVPTNLRVLRGNPGHRPLPKNEPKPAIEAKMPDPPPHIVGYAREEWFRVGEELHRLGLLSVLDYTALGAYCTAYAKWRDAEELLVELREQNMRGLLVSRSKYVTMNPLIRISLNAAAEMVRIASEFGFTPVARARISRGVGTKEDFGRFNGLIAG